MFDKIKTWLEWNSPIFMTRRKLLSILISHESAERDVDHKITWAVIRPVIFDLEELKKNTWDKDRIEHIQQWIKENFEVKNNKEKQNNESA